MLVRLAKLALCRVKRVCVPVPTRIGLTDYAVRLVGVWNPSWKLGCALGWTMVFPWVLGASALAECRIPTGNMELALARHRNPLGRAKQQLSIGQTPVVGVGFRFCKASNLLGFAVLHICGSSNLLGFVVLRIGDSSKPLGFAVSAFAVHQIPMVFGVLRFAGCFSPFGLGIARPEVASPKGCKRKETVRLGQSLLLSLGKGIYSHL